MKIRSIKIIFRLFVPSVLCAFIFVIWFIYLFFQEFFKIYQQKSANTLYLFNLYRSFIWWQYYECMHASIHPCMHACIHPSIHPCIHASMHACMHPCMHAYTHAHMHTCLSAYISASVHIVIHTYTHIHIHVHVHVHLHVHVHIHIHTHTHIHADTDTYTHIHMGSCQNYGPFLGTLNIRCRTILRTQRGTIILTTTHISIHMYIRTYVRIHT